MSKGPKDRLGLLALGGIPCVMLLLAMADWPYGYYVLLRFVVCGCAAILAFTAHKVGVGGWTKPIVFTTLGIALLYNPFLPIHLGNKDLWTIVNLATVAILVATVFACAGRTETKQESENP